MIFDNISFIKSSEKFKPEFTGRNIAPMFRKKFSLKKTNDAKLYVCGLGYGYYYINGKIVSNDLFTAPVSDYRKTLWYNVYNVSELLQEGENVLAVICGNGWYNEEFGSDWNYNEAEWRDQPKFILRLDIDEETILTSDAEWRCCTRNGIIFNALRSGECFDATQYDSDWADLLYDDSNWENVQIDQNPPKGVFRECKCEPIRACETLEYVNCISISENKQVLDFGKNISGFIRLDVIGEEGQEITIRYAEQIKNDYSRQLNDMERFYRGSDFQTDRLICNGKRIIWSPKFTYHGFQYAEIEGIKIDENNKAVAVFVHQDIEDRTEFTCSDSFLNKLFEAGKLSSLSNMFYMITDCPTREKLGWANDAQASMEQILTNFKGEKLAEKWLQDIYDAISEDGSMPGIIPTPGWGYHWGNGPVSDGVLFEIPYRVYLHTGNEKLLIDSLPYFEKYLSYLQTRTDEDGFVRFGLPDWAGPGHFSGVDPFKVPLEMINALLMSQFYYIASLASEFAKEYEKANLYKEYSEKLIHLVRSTYIDNEGKCVINKQSAAAMMIYYDVTDNQDILKKQLSKLLEDAGFKHDCGMVGLRRLFIALNKCGLQDYAMKIITTGGYPGYRSWFDQGATSLWEHWEYDKASDSKNHHMYSDVISWMMKTILGIREEWGNKNLCIEPYFFENLDYAKGSLNTCNGKVAVSWKRVKNETAVAGVELVVQIPEGIKATFGGTLLESGINKMLLKETTDFKTKWNHIKW